MDKTVRMTPREKRTRVLHSGCKGDSSCDATPLIREIDRLRAIIAKLRAR